MSWFAPNLPRDKHCFFDAQNGFSEGIYKSLNVGTRGFDDLIAVAKNLQKTAAYFGAQADSLNLMKQGVSAKVMEVENPTCDWYEVDGAVTLSPEVILCVRTADCAPVLLADYEHGVVGVAHAGWRGAWSGVVANVVDLMLEKGAKVENIAAAVGPCIAQKSYEVDENFYQQFICKKEEWNEFFVAGKAGHYQFDLEEFVKNQIIATGINNIATSGIDTYDEAQGYFSFRRLSLQGKVKQAGAFPVEMSAIKL